MGVLFRAVPDLHLSNILINLNSILLAHYIRNLAQILFFQSVCPFLVIFASQYMQQNTHPNRKEKWAELGLIKIRWLWNQTGTY